MKIQHKGQQNRNYAFDSIKIHISLRICKGGNRPKHTNLRKNYSQKLLETQRAKLKMDVHSTKSSWF